MALLELTEALERWTEHCREAGHKTRMELLEGHPSVAALRSAATYQLGYSRIFCCAPKCKWVYEAVAQEAAR